MRMWKKITVAVMIAYMPLNAIAQLDSCDVDVPYYFADLTGNPAGTWISPSHSRLGICCGKISPDPDNCTSFEILLDSQAVALSFDIFSGAVPSGSMFYQIDCGAETAVGDLICLPGIGPHRITFCKPGGNTNQYIIKSIPKPIFPQDDTTRSGCSKLFEVLGLDDSTITWNSVYPGAPGDYNSRLSCTDNCPTTVFTPEPSDPPYIDIEICGFPQADECGYILTVCDTFRITIMDSLAAYASPYPATFCQEGPGSGILLTASATGGNGIYSYIWKDNTGTTVDTTSTYFATSQGIYTLEARDGLVSATCISDFVSIPVSEGEEPIVNAGADQIRCATDPTAYLSGSVFNAAGGFWSGGNGIFSPDSTNLLASYMPTPSEIVAGYVNMVLTSFGAGGSCNEISDTVVIYYPDSININLSDTSLMCNSSGVVLTPEITGGVQPYLYLWSNGSPDTSVTVGEGNYCIDITDSLGCVASKCMNVTVPPELVVLLSSTDISTDGGSDGTATATPFGGITPYDFNWSNGDSTQTITGLNYGLYAVTVIDSNGCTRNSSVVVNEPRCLSFSNTVTATNINCFGDTNGTAITVPSGGTPPYTYLWDDPGSQTNDTAVWLSAGTYTLIATDSNDCIDIATATIIEPQELVNTLNHNDVTTVGGNDGSVTANPSGATAPYTYLWDAGDTTPLIDSLATGKYYITITDNFNCSILDSVMVNEPPCRNFRLYATATGVSCAGMNDGSANVSIVAATPPYAILWNDSSSQTTTTATNLYAGSYTVEVIDSFNCYTFSTITVTEPTQLSIGLSVTGISCNGENDGTIDLTVSGGTFPYLYRWENGMSAEDQVYASPGTYALTVTDANNCLVSDSAIIPDIPPINISHTTQNITCFAGSDGAIDVTVTGGVIPYTYFWSDSSTTEDLSGISAGLYWVNVTDANSCVSNAYFSILIVEPKEVHLDSMAISCPNPGIDSAAVVLFPDGGTPPYQISYDSGTSFQPIGDYAILLPIDSIYYLVIKDTNACYNSVLDTLSINPAVAVSGISFAKCYYSTTATTNVTVTPVGGNGGPYRVSYDNGSSFGAYGDYSTMLPTDSSYNVIVQDSLSCISEILSITIPDSFNLLDNTSLYAGNYNITCNSYSDGSIDLNVSGGAPPYAYSWSTGDTVENITNLTAGIYHITISDTNGCSLVDSITLTEPALLSDTISAISNYNGYHISCYGFNDGAINLTVSGGTSPYSYIWNNGDTLANLSGLTSGTYSVTTTDNNNCTVLNSIVLTQPASLLDTIIITSDYNGNDISCNGSADGVVDLAVSGGAAPYTYAWANGDSTEDIANLGGGVYVVIITDNNNCQITDSIVLTDPIVLSGVLQSTFDYNGYDISCSAYADGAIGLTVGGGTAPYSYQWSNGDSVEDPISLGAEIYDVIITDINGCIGSGLIQLTEPALLVDSIYITSDYAGYSISCYGESDGSVDLNVAGGVTPYTYSWSSGQVTEDLSGIPSGAYNIALVDANGCQVTDSVELFEPGLITLTAIIEHATCNGFTNGSVDLAVSGGVSPYTYNWSNGATTQDLVGVGVGNYSVTLNDLNACVSTLDVSVNEELPIVLSFATTDLRCYQSNDGTIDLTISGGAWPFSVNWSSGQSSEDIGALQSGQYTVTVQDFLNCYITDTVTIMEPNALYAEIYSPTYNNGYNVSYNLSSDGSIELTVEGGTTPYTYSWSNGETSSDLGDIQAGDYSVVITDNNACSLKKSIVINEPLMLEMPTGFSPNGDGKNDYFFIRGLEAYPQNSLKVFNRWGNQVYGKENYDNDWAGENDNGERLSSATYYVIFIIKGSNIELTGYVDIRR